MSTKPYLVITAKIHLNIQLQLCKQETLYRKSKMKALEVICFKVTPPHNFIHNLQNNNYF